MSDIILCPVCGQANRIPALAAGQKAVCGRCKTPLPGGDGREHPVALTDATFNEFIGSGSTIVDFWTAWCGPCRMIAPLLEQIAAERSDIRIGKLNVDENPHTTAAFHVQGIPLLIFFSGGIERGRIVGAVPRAQIETAIRQFFGG